MCVLSLFQSSIPIFHLAKLRNVLLRRSCWHELAALCVKEELQVPQWDEILAVKTELVSRGVSSDSLDGEIEAEKMMYVNFLVHVYLELHRGDLAMKVRRLF